MKKKIILILAVIMAFVLMLTGYAANKEKKYEKELIKTEEKINKKIEKAFKTKDMEKILRNNRLYEDEISKNMTRYIKTVIDYNLPDEVNSIFLKEAEKGKDLDKLIDAFEFLFMANKDYALIDDMYEYGKKSNFKKSHWCENAYNELTDCVGGVLTTEQILEYTKKGLTYDDILTANKLCFSGKKKINEILDEKLKGKAWVDIVNNVYPDIKISKSVYGNVNQTELVRYAEESLKYEENINEMYDRKTKKRTQKSEMKKQKRNEMLNKKLSDNKYAFVLDDKMINYAKKEIPELEEEKIYELMNKGYLIREIKQGVFLAEKHKTSLENAMKINYIKEAE